MDFESAVEYLKGFISYEATLNFQYDEENFDLQRLRSFLEDYGVDYSKLKYIHVGGSKGKGSISTMVAQYLFRTGKKTALFTSPYILDIRECFWVDSELISKEDFLKYVEDLKQFIGDSGGCKLTYFELLTVLVLKYFVDQGVDYAVLEVGLGGRLDSTNIVIPELSILSTVEKEHTSILGESYEEILDEKLGIVKEGAPFLVSFQSDEVKAIIKRKLGDRDRLYFVDEIDWLGEIDFEHESLVQKKNALTAVMAINILFSEVDLNLFQQILNDFTIPGRFEIRDYAGKKVVFDMAHTIMSVDNLLKSLELNFPSKKFVFLVSILKDKDVEGILDMISGFADRLVLTSIESQRGLSAAELNRGKDFELMENPKKAFESLLNSLSDDEVLVVTGSHYLIQQLL